MSSNLADVDDRVLDGAWSQAVHEEIEAEAHGRVFILIKTRMGHAAVGGSKFHIYAAMGGG